MHGSRISVLIVEEHSVVRWALRRFLEEEGMSTVGEAASISEAIDLSDIQEPDVILMDAVLDDSSIEVVRKLVDGCGRRVVVLGDCCDSEQLEAFFAAGGKGFVSKNSSVKDIPTAIRAVVDNRTWVSQNLLSEHSQREPHGTGEQVLSAREREVAIQIARGLSSSQAAAKLYVSLNTVETHRYRIFRKLGIHSRAELVDYVLKHGLIKR